MHRFLIALLLIAISTAGSFNPANAAIVSVLHVQSDYFPSRDYQIGLDLDPQQLISEMYFQNEKGKQTFYSLDQLKSFSTIFEMAGFTLVSMRISKVESPQSATIELQILHNYLTGNRRSIFFHVGFNPVTHQYEISDARSGKVIHQVTVVTHYIALVPVGIYDLATE